MAEGGDAKQISGGCLCGSVRYTVRFDTENPWPLKIDTCQCTMCRKHTGSIVAHFFTTPKSHLTLSHEPPYTEFKSSSHGYRTFCGRCGSNISFLDDNCAGDADIFAGTIDEGILIGNVIAGSEKKTEHGVLRERDGVGHGREFLMGGRHYYFENAIKGITDELPGPKFPEGSRDAEGKALKELP